MLATNPKEFFFEDKTYQEHHSDCAPRDPSPFRMRGYKDSGYVKERLPSRCKLCNSPTNAIHLSTLEISGAMALDLFNHDPRAVKFSKSLLVNSRKRAAKVANSIIKNGRRLLESGAGQFMYCTTRGCVSYCSVVEADILFLACTSRLVSGFDSGRKRFFHVGWQ